MTDQTKTAEQLAAENDRLIQQLTTDNERLRSAYEDQTTKQLTRADLATMTPQQIVKAQQDGRLKDLMVSGDPTTQTGYRTKSGPGTMQGHDPR